MENMCSKCGYYKTPPQFWSGTGKPLICNCPKKETTLDEIKDLILDNKYQQQQQYEFAIGFVEWFTNEKSEYSIMYGNQEKRFATFTKAYTTKELLEIYKKEKGL